MGTRRYPTTMMCDGELLAAFEPTTRDTDVFVSAAAKCGQTWTMNLLHHLRTRGGDPAFEGRGHLGVMPWLENPRDMTNGRVYDRAERLAEIEACADPRVFKMHVVYDEIPRPEGSRAKIITVSRDARDVAYSMYAHLQGLDPAIIGRAFDVPFEAWFEGWVKDTYWFPVMKSFWPHRDDPDLLWLRYEDMKADLGAQARRIVDFLGWDVDGAAIDRAVALSDLRAMQKAEDTRELGIRFKDGHRFIREGGVGKNRARLTPEQQERIVERARRELEPDCFEFVMAQGV